MNKCVKITLLGKLSEAFMHNIIQANASQLKLEGTCQLVQENEIRIFLCGTKETIDEFLDRLHKDSAMESISSIEVEPFLKEKEFRGVFRVIE